MDLRDAPRVEESEEAEDDERAQASLSNKGDKHSDLDDEDEDDLAQDIDLDDLAAMEGPDA